MLCLSETFYRSRMKRGIYLLSKGFFLIENVRFSFKKKKDGRVIHQKFLSLFDPYKRESKHGTLIYQRLPYQEFICSSANAIYGYSSIYCGVYFHFD